MSKPLPCAGCEQEFTLPNDTQEHQTRPRLCLHCRSDGELHSRPRRGAIRPCANCDLSLDVEDILAGRRICLACRSDRERFNRRWQKKFRRCYECGRGLKAGFCSRCYWKHHRRSRRYEPMDPDLQQLKYKKRRDWSRHKKQAPGLPPLR